MRSLAIFLLLVTAVPGLRAQGPPPALVETASIQEIDFHHQINLVGRTEARSESRIVAEVSGRVSSVNAVEGRRVRRGDVLVTIDCRRLAFDLDAKKAEAAQAEADAGLAEKELRRAQELVDTEVFPERNLDAAVAEASRTEQRHRQLEAERKRLELDLENCKIRAPYDGHTVSKLVDVGEWVDPGTAVYEMVDLTLVKVTVDLPERHFGQVELGSPVSVSLSGATDAPQLEGEVYGIAPRASETTHTFPVLLAIRDGGRRLGSGMLVRATLDLKRTFRGLAISKDAIVRQGEATFVYTVSEGQAQSKPVRILATQGTRVAIEGEGLSVGMPIVVRGNERLFPGSPVRTGDAAAPTAGGGG